MLFNEEFYNVMELKIYSGYGSILPWIQSICNEELKQKDIVKEAFPRLMKSRPVFVFFSARRAVFSARIN